MNNGEEEKLYGEKRVKKYMHKEIKIKYNFTMYMDRNVAGWLSRAGGEAAIPVRPRAGVNMLTRLMSGLRAGENTQPT